ncbi:MAG: hypothetical protein ACLQVM_07415 [Terriglobia bacterium]
MKRNIRKCFGTLVLSLGVLLAASIPALAKNSRTVTLHHDVVLSGATLSAGQYTIQWETHNPAATVRFVQGHKVVLSTEGKVEQRDKSYDRDAVVINSVPNGSMSVTEIRFAGSKQVLVFNQ